MTTFDRLQEYLMLTVGSSEAKAILQLAVQLVEEEREACANVAEAKHTRNAFHGYTYNTQAEIAAAIRCRE